VTSFRRAGAPAACGPLWFFVPGELGRLLSDLIDGWHRPNRSGDSQSQAKVGYYCCIRGSSVGSAYIGGQP
jgi:hypothetical protein